MAYSFQNKYPDWPVPTQLWVLDQIAEGRTYKQIHADLSSEKPESRPDNVPQWTGSYYSCKKRMTRLSSKGIGLVGIDTESGEQLQYDLSTDEGRYQYWVFLARTTTSTAVRISALTQIEKIMSRLNETENTEDAKQERKEMLAGGRAILNDPGRLIEVINVQLASSISEGYEDWVIDAVVSWILNNPTIADRVVCAVVAAIPDTIKITETNSAKITRLLGEFRSLSEVDQAEMQRLAAFVDGDMKDGSVADFEGGDSND